MRVLGPFVITVSEEWYTEPHEGVHVTFNDDRHEIDAIADLTG